METLSRLSSGLGNPIYADECTTRVDRISFARVLVKMDVTVPLPQVIKVKDPTGKAFEQEVWYDWEPEFCETCLLVGHNCNGAYSEHIPDQLPRQVAEQKEKQGNEQKARQKVDFVQKQQHRTVNEWRAKSEIVTVQPGGKVAEQQAEPIRIEQKTEKALELKQGQAKEAQENIWQSVKGKSVTRSTKSPASVSGHINTENGFSPLSQQNITHSQPCTTGESGQCSQMVKEGLQFFNILI